MLAYLLRHWPLQGLDRGDYEATLLQFHRSIANESPAGFTGHSSFDLRKHRGSRRPARSTKTGISWRILLPWNH
jgi:hypothetical protein